ncbi:SGNH/GDSL hydrolase family protein [Algibacter sp.]|uniref:SGNH/GDSL hydrolase family protein n=1 Tax=Algibacter sp. TaxID=1872428 RepID=UPI003C73716F
MKIIKIMVLIFITVFILAVSFYLFNRFSFSKAYPFYEVSAEKNTTLTVGIIGDSWVDGSVLDSNLRDAFIKNSMACNIISSGNSTARSKLIYENLFKESTDKYSSKHVIKSRPDYCIVIAGVNDTHGQIGPEFYAHHIKLIIKTLLHYNIKPVIVELPEYGIVEATNDMGFIRKYRSIISSKINNKGEIDNIKTYRIALTNVLKKENLTDKIIFVDFEKVCADFETCKTIYKPDGLHLNSDGNKLLSDVIAKKIAETHPTNQIPNK